MRKTIALLLMALLITGLTACSVKSMHGLVRQTEGNRSVSSGSALRMQDRSLAGQGRVANANGLTVKGGAAVNGTEESQEVPAREVSHYAVYSKNQYCHLDSEYVKLGDGETVTVEINASPAGLSYDDFLVCYDEEMLTMVSRDLKTDKEAGTTDLYYVFKAAAEGRSDILIISIFDYCAYGDDADCFDIPTYGYGPNDGKIVYVTYTGEKYHYSSDCAGDNAMGTTLLEAKECEYEPCGKCAR